MIVVLRSRLCVSCEKDDQGGVSLFGILKGVASTHKYDMGVLKDRKGGRRYADSCLEDIGGKKYLTVRVRD